MAELNIIEKANKIITFRKYIREECRKKGLEYPSDEKIAEYIADCGGDDCVYDLNDFMCDYENKIGVFKDPFNDFKAEVFKYSWTTPPSDEEMRSYVAENGYDVQGFLRYRIINTMRPLEKATLLATLKLDDVCLVELWNEFIEESCLYGEDSYIYDLTASKDIQFIQKNFPNDKKAELTRLIRNAKLHGKELRFFQWFNLNDNEIHVKDDIKGIIIAYWGEIFERVMLYPLAYEFKVEKYAKGDGSTYFDDVFFPCIAEMVGYKIDGSKGTITKIEK